MSSSGKIIAIAGTVATGKTTLGSMFKEHASSVFLEEDWRTNPYVIGPKATDSSGLSVNLAFLMMRHEQNKLAQARKSAGLQVVVDTLFEMSDMYSSLGLDAVDYALFKKMYNHLYETLAKPDLIVYLYARPELIFERAKERNRQISVEGDWVTMDKIQQADALIKQAIEQLGVPVIAVDVEQHDFRQPEVFHNLFKNYISTH